MSVRSFFINENFRSAGRDFLMKKAPEQNRFCSGARIQIPRYHPHWNMDEKSIFPLSARNECERPDLLITDMATCSIRLLRQCSRNLLFQTALSVGDAVFLSVSEDSSLLQRILIEKFITQWLLEFNIFLKNLIKLS
jgi:hypothetical protein